MFGERLRVLRSARGLKQEEVGEELGVSKQCVSNWENGNSMPSVDLLVRIADMFYVQTDYLLGRSERTSLCVEDMDADLLAIVQNLVSYLKKMNSPDS